jgi:hypothetical protein
MNPPAPSSPPTRLHRTLVLALAVAALVFAWARMATIAEDDPWYRNTDMNIHNMADALAINSSHSPNTVDQPGLTVKFLLALDFRVRHELGQLPVWNMRKFGQSPDPLHEIPPLIRVEKAHSRILVLLVILAAAGLTYAVTRATDSACLTVILLCGSSGLLFHGLLLRPELLCVGLGNVLALLCAWQSTRASHWRGKTAWLFAAGILVGLAALAKLPGVCYLALCYTWCWLAALITLAENPTPARAEAPGFWRGLVPALAGVSMLWLLSHLAGYHDGLGDVVVHRLRTVAVLVGLLPLLTLWPGPNPLGRFLRDRCLELALLIAGSLAALPLAYLLLRTVMTEPAASTYLARTLHFLIDPGPTMNLFLSAKPDILREFMIFLKESPVICAGTLTAAIGVSLLDDVTLRLRAFILLLIAGAFGLTLLMCRRFFADQYTIFFQVPLLLALSLSLSALGLWWRRRLAAGVPWTVPLVLIAAFVLTLTIHFRLKSKYPLYQDAVPMPVNELTLTFMFDHDAHPGAYLEIMKSRYGNREQFARILDAYLANPANRR